MKDGIDDRSLTPFICGTIINLKAAELILDAKLCIPTQHGALPDASSIAYDRSGIDLTTPVQLRAWVATSMGRRWFWPSGGAMRSPCEKAARRGGDETPQRAGLRLRGVSLCRELKLRIPQSALLTRPYPMRLYRSAAAACGQQIATARARMVALRNLIPHRVELAMAGSKLGQHARVRSHATAE
jgi:hypothetical protein